VNGQEILILGLRCSNALLSDKTTQDLIDHLDPYKSYGINTVSVFLMGSRFGDVKGYNEDGSLNPIYTERLGKIIREADTRGMLVLVGCLYWGGSKAKWQSWTQAQIQQTLNHTRRGLGYMLASTRLQCVPPHGPNANPGDGSADNPGIRWWLEFVRETYGPYEPPTGSPIGYYED